jgi:hypothetical protein
MLEFLEARNAPGSISGAMTGTDPSFTDASQISVAAPAQSTSDGSTETQTNSTVVATNSAATTNLTTNSPSTTAQAPSPGLSTGNSSTATSASDAVFTSPITPDLFAPPMTSDSSASAASAPPGSSTSVTSGGGTASPAAYPSSPPTTTPTPTAVPDAAPPTPLQSPALGVSLNLQPPVQSSGAAPQVSLLVTDPNGVAPDGTAATLLVDVNQDGTFAASVSGVVQSGVAVFTLPTLTPGSYAMKAQLTDATGVVLTSNVQTTMVQPQSGAATSGSDSGAVLVAGGGLGTGSNSGGGTGSGPGSGTSSGDGSGSGSGSNAGSGSILESGALAMAPAPIVGITDVQQQINELQQQVKLITGAIIHAQQMADYEYNMYEYFNSLANQERGFIRAIVDNPNDANSSAQNLENAYVDLFLFDQMQVTYLQSVNDWISYQAALKLICTQIDQQIAALQSP